MKNFPDVQRMLIELLAGYGTVAVQTTATLEDNLPFITVQRGGGRDNFFTDTASVTIQVFSSTYSGMAIAETIRQFLTDGPHVSSIGVIDRVTTDSGPIEVPWTDQSTVRRFTATYRLRVRR